MGSLFAVRLLLDKKRENPLERRDSIGGGGRGFGGDRSAGSATCDVNAFSSNKYTALHIATRHRYMEIVKVLLQVPSASSSHSSLHNFKASVLILQTLISTLLVLVTAEFLPKAIVHINPNNFLTVSSLIPFCILSNDNSPVELNIYDITLQKLK
jgi:ankyrin repeat protein